MVEPDKEAAFRAWKAIGLSGVLPVLAYLLIFHHFRCETGAEQFTAALLGLTGLLAAIKFA